MKKRSITVKNLLKFMMDLGDDLLFLDRKGAWKLCFSGSKTLDNFDDYFPSHVERAVGNLMRRGWVQKIETAEGIRVILTENGKKQMLLFDMEKFEPKKVVWDGKWRVIFFDVEEIKHSKRDSLRKYLKKLGWQKMQESVYVSPYDSEQEVRYVREVLDIPHGVKIGVMDKIENDGDLRKMFGI